MLITNNSENRVVIRIPMYDKHVNFSDLEIHQEILQHSRFQFLWRISSDVLTNPLEDFRYFGNNLDNEITFSFYTTTGKEILYKGLITGLKMINTDKDFKKQVYREKYDLNRWRFFSIPKGLELVFLEIRNNNFGFFYLFEQLSVLSLIFFKHL